MKTLYVGSDNTVTLTCPACDKAKTVDVGRYLTRDGPITFTYRFQCEACRCGHHSCQECIRENCSLGKVSSVRLERRKKGRKKVLLPATFAAQGQEGIRVKIVDISRWGFRLEMALHLKYDKGCRGVIDFELDDPHSTRIRKKVELMRCRGGEAVFRFVEDESYCAADKALGFYLLNTGNKE